MFKNVYEVLAYLGDKTELFKLIGEEMLRLKNENEELKNTLNKQENAITELTMFVAIGGNKNV